MYEGFRATREGSIKVGLGLEQTDYQHDRWRDEEYGPTGHEIIDYRRKLDLDDGWRQARQWRGVKARRETARKQHCPAGDAEGTIPTRVDTPRRRRRWEPDYGCYATIDDGNGSREQAPGTQMAACGATPTMVDTAGEEFGQH